jgi:hypothetical protein
MKALGRIAAATIGAVVLAHGDYRACVPLMRAADA